MSIGKHADCGKSLQRDLPAGANGRLGQKPTGVMPTEKVPNRENAERKKYRLREADRGNMPTGKNTDGERIPFGENADWEEILTKGNTTEGNSD
jgi:hypothetical protein